MTQEFLQDAVVEDLQDLFKDYRLKNSLGVERAINIFSYDTPIREGDDEAADREAPPEPYIVVRIPGGNIQDETAPHVVEVILIACVCDRDKNRQGYRDAAESYQELLAFLEKGASGTKDGNHRKERMESENGTVH